MKRVLVADDDPDILETLSLLLETRYAVTAVGDGALALELLARHAFDAVVLDLTSPVLDGTRVLAELRQRGNAVPVILISAHRDLEQQQLQHRELGAFASLRKPFDIRELEQRLEEALSRGGPSGHGGGMGDGSLPPPRGPEQGGHDAHGGPSALPS